MSSTNPNVPGGGGDVDQTPTDAKALPKDALVIIEILKDMGIEHDQKVITHLLEFLYRYVTTVVEDAKLVSNHAKKKIIDIEDVRLAVQMYNDQNFCSPPPRDVLLEVARTRNANPLPPPKPSSSTGVRLPPDRFTLTAANYRLASSNKKSQQFSGRSSSAGTGNTPSGIGNLTSGSSGAPTYTIRTSGQNNPTRPIITMNQSTMPKIQLSSGANLATPTFTMTVNAPTTQSVKRKADD